MSRPALLASVPFLTLAALAAAFVAAPAPARADEPTPTAPSTSETVEEEAFVVEHDGQPLRVRVRRLLGGEGVEVEATDEAPRVMKAVRIVRPGGPVQGLPGGGPRILGGELEGMTDAHPRMRRLRELFLRGGATDGDDAPLMRRVERLEQENRRMRGELTRLQHQMQRLMGARGMDRPQAPSRGSEDRLERIEKLLEKLIAQKGDAARDPGPRLGVGPGILLRTPHVAEQPLGIDFEHAQREMRERMERAQKEAAEQRERMQKEHAAQREHMQAEQAQQRMRVEARMREVERTLDQLEMRLREADQARRAALEEAAALRAQKAALEEALRAAQEKAAAGAK
ncbi:MAG: hypothetical protein AB7T63_00870 [Planctomycetota bacterium]